MKDSDKDPIGSNVANIMLVLGIVALIYPIDFTQSYAHKDNQNRIDFKANRNQNTLLLVITFVILGLFLVALDLLAPKTTPFIGWQGILLLGIGIAVQIDSAKSSAEQ